MKPHRRTVSHKPATSPFVELCPTQEAARDTLVQLSQGLTFAKVVSVQVQAKHWIGEAIEVPVGHAERDLPKNIFFDKFGRCRGAFKVGPMTLVQCPQGPDHPTSVPVVGEILVGTAVANQRTKSHLQYVLRGWSSNAKPLWELFRMVRFGTRMTEAKVRDLLIQLPCMMTFCSPELKPQRDEIYMIGRMVLQGNLRPLAVLAHHESPELTTLKEPASEIELMAAKQTLIGSTAFEFIDMCTIKLNCPALQEKFQELLEFKEAPPRPGTPPGYADPQTNMQSSLAPAATAPSTMPQQTMAPSNMPLFAPSTYFSGYTTNQAPTSPPASPKQAPASPTASPKAAEGTSTNPGFAPASPRAPASPMANLDEDF